MTSINKSATHIRVLIEFMRPCTMSHNSSRALISLKKRITLSLRIVHSVSSTRIDPSSPQDFVKERIQVSVAPLQQEQRLLSLLSSSSLQNIKVYIFSDTNQKCMLFSLNKNEIKFFEFSYASLLLVDLTEGQQYQPFCLWKLQST